MNLSQLLEGVVGKNTMMCSEFLKTNPSKSEVIETMNWLNEGTIKNLTSRGEEYDYYQDVKGLIGQLDDDEYRERFINEVSENNLFVEAPSFSKVNIRQIYKNSVYPIEDVRIKRETLMYIKDKIKMDVPFPLTDAIIKDAFCVPIYVMKLHKLSEHIISARDLGPVKHITKLPLKGKSVEGGSKIGQMEIKTLVSYI